MEKKWLKKKQDLRKTIRNYGGAAVAFSGGVDSSVVLKVAVEVLGKRALGITADNPALPRHELKATKDLARAMGVQHVIIKTNEIDDENYQKNPANRCYFCKSELYGRIKDFLATEQLPCVILNGTNQDDLGDYRPGLKAAEEAGIKSPLLEHHWTKEEVRQLAKELGLNVWDKPSSPCLASRIPYHHLVTAEKLATIEKAENILRSYKFQQLRVRHWGEKAQIEVEPKEKEKLLKHWDEVEHEFRKLGFKKISWHPFKSGSLNILPHGTIAS